MDQIVRAETAPAIEEARRLFLEYRDALGLDLEFQGFAAEVAGLPGEYAPPGGVLLLLVQAGQVLGCVAVRRFEGDTAELKRLYLRPAGRGRGRGRLLTEAAIAEARGLGYRKIRLDTLPSMRSAIALYESLGFHEIEPYRLNPIPGATYWEMEIKDSVD